MAAIGKTVDASINAEHSKKGPSPGVFLLAALRGADPVLQYGLFSRGWGVKIATSVGLSGTQVLLKAGPGLGGLGSLPTLMTGLYSLAALRHVYWAYNNATANDVPYSRAAFVGFINTFGHTITTLFTVNTLSTLTVQLASAALTRDNLKEFITSFSWPQYAGVGLFAFGAFVELYSEYTRKLFKQNPSNAGKIDNTSLWSVVRHPNYAGFAIWKTGIALASGSVAWAAVFAGLQITQLLTQAVPGLSAYLKTRYGEQYDVYEKQVPYTLFPFVV